MDPNSTPNDEPGLLSTDTSPLASRPQGTAQEEEDVALEFPEPPPDWQFNMFLNSLADEISVEEFQKTKHFFTGIIGKKVLEECQSVNDVFTIMRQRYYLNNDNLLYLQSIVFGLKRRDLLEMCIEYSRRVENVLHFKQTSDHPAEDYRFVKFHVEGKDFVNCKRNYIEKLRKTVATILYVPETSVFIAGVEPSSSMLITLMIPEMYADVLQTMLEKSDTMGELVEIGIDIIGIDNQQYNIRGIEEAELILTDQQTKLVNVYQQLQTKTKQLAESEIDCLKLTRKLENLDKHELSKDAVLATLHQMFNTVGSEPIPPTLESSNSTVPGPVNSARPTTPARLSSQTALKEFKAALKCIDDKQYERDLIMVLLHANTTITVNRMRESFHIGLKRLCIEIEDLESKVIPLTVELEKYKFVVQVNSGQLDTIILEGLVNVVKRSIELEENISMSINYVNASTKVSRMLRFKEKTKLKLRYQWPDDDPITETMNKESTLFLCCIYLKEVELTKTAVDLVPFLTKCLEDVGRKDLVTKFQDLIKVAPVSTQRRQKGPKKNVQESTTKKGTTRARSQDGLPMKSKDIPEDKDTHTDLSSMARQVNAIQEKLESMHKIMEAIQGKPPSYASLCSDGYPMYAKQGYPFRFQAGANQAEQV